MHHLLADIGVAILCATVTTLITHFLRQPMILGYLAAGILIGPYFTPQLVTDTESIELISEIGLILLLFIIGLELNPQHLLANGRMLLITGSLQFPLNAALAWLLFLFLPFAFTGVERVYLAFFCALSSTAIVVKSLHDKFALDSLPGRVTLGVLLFQDVWAILILVMQPNFNNPQWSLMLFAVCKAGFLLVSGFLVSRYLLSPLFRRVSDSPELVVSLSIGWCVMVAVSAHFLGLSIEMGALVAGVSISTFPYHIHVTARISPLRDVFMTLFFISLGMKIPPLDVESIPLLSVMLAAVVFLRFAVIYPLVRLSGGSPRTGFLASLNLTQVSEFSPVIAAIALKYGHVQKPLMVVLLYALGISAVVSSYFIKYGEKIHGWSGLLFPGRQKRTVTEEEKTEALHPIVILGFHRGARALIEQLKESRENLLPKILVVDWNLEVLKELSLSGIGGVFGDISSAETLRHAGLSKAAIIISTVPDLLLKGTNNLKLVKICRQLAPEAVIFATADLPEQKESLLAAGANQVVLPYSLAGKAMVEEMIVLSGAELAELTGSPV